MRQPELSAADRRTWRISLVVSLVLASYTIWIMLRYPETRQIMPLLLGGQAGGVCLALASLAETANLRR